MACQGCKNTLKLALYCPKIVLRYGQLANYLNYCIMYNSQLASQPASQLKMICTHIQYVKKSNFLFTLLKDPYFSGQSEQEVFILLHHSPPPHLFIKLHSLLKGFSLQMFLPYLMLALTNPVYLLLTDKSNRAGISTIIYT